MDKQTEQFVRSQLSKKCSACGHEIDPDEIVAMLDDMFVNAPIDEDFLVQNASLCVECWPEE